MQSYHNKGSNLNTQLDRLNLTRRHLDLYACLLGLYPSPNIAQGQRGRQSNRCQSRFGYIKVHDGRWTTADPKWKLSDSQLAQHLSNQNTFGIKGTAQATRWLDIDIDHAEANFDDPRLRKITDFLYQNLVSHDGRPRYLVQYRPQSGNFSILLRADGGRAAAHHHQLTELCHHLGLEIGAGQIELFPDPQRGRRLPFGDQLVFEESGFNELTAVALKKDQIQKLAQLEPIRIGQLQKLIPLRLPQPPKTDRQSKNNHNTDRRLAVAHPSAQFPPLQQPGTRWEMEKWIGLQCYKRGLNTEQAKSSLEKWFTDGGTAGLSQEYQDDPAATVERAKAHIDSLYKWSQDKGISSKPILQPNFSLRKRDFDKIAALDLSLKGQEFLYDLLLWAGPRQGAMPHLYLSTNIMSKFRNGSRPNHYLAQLDQLGILKCIANTYARGQQSRIYSLHWTYSSSHTQAVDPYKSYRALLRQYLNKSQIQQLKRRNGEKEISRRDVKRILDGQHIQQHGRTRILKRDGAWLRDKLANGKILSPSPLADAGRGLKSVSSKEKSIKNDKLPTISINDMIKQRKANQNPEREAKQLEIFQRLKQISAN
tara:strand:+ start:3263 stop:5044 length:1782 start_codon:yes stop_codon:yes gene_type:complete